jgi:acyl-coenzyme A thioesterase PaaI-like protein
MKLTPFKAKWMMNFYPPLLVNRIFVKSISSDFRMVSVRIRKSWINRNLQGTIFGGTIFSAADPFYALMYWQVFKQKGYKCEAWLKSAEIDYLKPGTTDLDLVFELTELDIEEALKELALKGRFQKTHLIEMINTNGEVCAQVKTLVYLRIPRLKEQDGKSVF